MQSVSNRIFTPHNHLSAEASNACSNGEKSQPLEVYTGNSDEKITYEGVRPPIRKLMVNSHWPTPFDHHQSSPYSNKPEYRRFTDSPQSTPTCWFSTLFMTIYAQTFSSACFIQNLIPNRPLIAVCLSCSSPLYYFKINRLYIMLYFYFTI